MRHPTCDINTRHLQASVCIAYKVALIRYEVNLKGSEHWAVLIQGPNDVAEARRGLQVMCLGCPHGAHMFRNVRQQILRGVLNDIQCESHDRATEVARTTSAQPAARVLPFPFRLPKAELSEAHGTNPPLGQLFIKRRIKISC